MQLCDGAMKANNPTMVALEEAARLAGKRLQHFIHVGSLKLKDLNVCNPKMYSLLFALLC